MTGIENTGLRIIEFILALGFMMFVHEFGHYIVSRIFRIPVEEFGFGLPPRLVKLFTWHGTEFTLNWIPLGAFVRPKGEGDPTIPDGMAASSPWKRLGILLAGPSMNLLVGMLLFSLIFTRMGTPDTTSVQIIGVTAGSPAETSGMQVNDLIRAVNGNPITSTDQAISVVKAHTGEEITLTLERNGNLIDITTTPRSKPPEGEGALGILLGNPVVKTSWISTIPSAANMVGEQVNAILTLPGKLIAKSITPEEGRVVSIKGIYDIYAQVRTRDLAEPNNDPTRGMNTAWFLATISVGLGIANLLPIPAVDGGRILFLLPEFILRKRIPQQFENTVNGLGLLLLLVLMVVLTINDFVNPIVLP